MLGGKLIQYRNAPKWYTYIISFTGIHKIAHFLNDLSKKNNYSMEELKSYIRFKQKEKTHKVTTMSEMPLEALNVVSITAPPSMYDALLKGDDYSNG